MIIGGNTGPALYADGAQNVPATTDRLGGIKVTELRARYAENTRRGLRMHGANQAAVTTSAGLSLTNTGLILFNPVGSTVNLEVDKVGFANVVAWTAATAIGIQAGFAGAALAGVTVDGQYNANINGPVGQGLIYKAATTVAPFIRMVFGSTGSAAVTVPETQPMTWLDLEGAIVVTPGSWMSFYTSVASGASGFFGAFQWTETPV